MTEPLLVALQRRANFRGHVLVREELLLREIKLGRERLDRALAGLQRMGQIAVLSPAPYLVIRLEKWSGVRRKAEPSLPLRYSYELSNRKSMNSYSGPSREALLSEILDTLGSSDREAFQQAVERYSPAVIRRALERVRQTKSIRKNPTALFRYLLVKLAA